MSVPNDLLEKITPYFENKQELDKFLNTETSAFGSISPLEFLKSSKMEDKEEFFLNTVIQLKTNLGFYEE